MQRNRFEAARLGRNHGPMVKVREAKPDDWETLRDVRLAALSEAPYAFGSTYAREAVFTQDQWRARLAARAVNFFAYVQDVPDAVPAGLAGVFVADGMADLVSMWVRPSARGFGVGQALVEAAAGWARARHHDILSLWVTESNPAARKLYERCGFTPTGERQPLPSDTSLEEIRMLRAL
jgi:GNAT superfamily N-acetyltransferase